MSTADKSTPPDPMAVAERAERIIQMFRDEQLPPPDAMCVIALVFAQVNAMYFPAKADAATLAHLQDVMTGVRKAYQQSRLASSGTH